MQIHTFCSGLQGMSPTGTRRAENGKWQQVAVWLRNSPGEALWEEAKQDCFCDNVFWVTENVEVFQETWLAIHIFLTRVHLCFKASLNPSFSKIPHRLKSCWSHSVNKQGPIPPPSVSKNCLYQGCKVFSFPRAGTSARKSLIL